LLVLAIVCGSLLPQAPAHVRSDTVRYQEWRAPIQAKFKNWTPLLEAIGAFDIYGSPWFHVLLAALAFLTLVSLSNQIALLIKFSRARQPESFYHTPDTVVISGELSAAQVVTTVRQAMQTLFRHIEQVANDNVTYMYASLSPWATGSHIAIYVGLLLAVCGLAVNGRWGWQQTDVQLFPREPVFVGPTSSHRMQLVDTEDVSGKVTLETGKRQRIHIKPRGRTYRDAYLYQLTDKGGLLIQVSAQRDDGEQLVLYHYTARPEPAEPLRFAFSRAASEEEDYRLFIVMDEKTISRLKWLNPDRTAQESQFHLWVFRQGSETPSEKKFTVENKSTQVTINNITYTLQVFNYVVLNVNYQPGLWAITVGSMLVVIGLWGTLVPQQRMWSSITFQEGRVTVRIRDETKGISHRLRRRRDTALGKLRVQIEET
jgi:hypothetical protein